MNPKGISYCIQISCRLSPPSIHLLHTPLLSSSLKCQNLCLLTSSLYLIFADFNFTGPFYALELPKFPTWLNRKITKFYTYETWTTHFGIHFIDICNVFFFFLTIFIFTFFHSQFARLSVCPIPWFYLVFLLFFFFFPFVTSSRKSLVDDS